MTAPCRRKCQNGSSISCEKKTLQPHKAVQKLRIVVLKLPQAMYWLLESSQPALRSEEGEGVQIRTKLGSRIQLTMRAKNHKLKMHNLFYRLFSTVDFNFRLIDCVVGLQLIFEITWLHREKVGSECGWALSVDIG